MRAAERIVELERRLAARERDLEVLRGGAPAPPASTAGKIVWALRVAAVVVIGIALIGVLAPVDREVVADTIPRWVHHATAWVVVALFIALLLPGAAARWRGARILLLLLPAFVAGGVGADLPSQLNRDRGRGPAMVAHARVLTRATRTSSNPRDAILLSSWWRPGCAIRVLPRRLGLPGRPGDAVDVTRRPGIHGWEWIETIEEPVSP